MVRKTKHIPLVTLLTLFVILLMYLGDVPWLGSEQLDKNFFSGQVYYELCLLIFILPVIYAGIIFRVKGGIIVSIVTTLAVLPHEFFFSPYIHPFSRLAASTIIEVLLAGLIGTYLNNKERQEKERVKLERFLSETMESQERERQYLARELHDDSLQMMVDISHQIDELLEGKDDDLTKPNLKQLHQEVDAVIERTHRFIRGLRPPLLEELGLGSSLKWLGEELDDRDVRIRVNIRGEERRLSDLVELSLLRIAQEALTNARKHSKATDIEVSLVFLEDRIQLIVSDNGVGFRVPPTEELLNEARFGLIGMRERARLISGIFLLHSTLGKGSVVSVEVPLRE